MRLVVLGLGGAGKTALLGSLARAAGAIDPINGRVSSVASEFTEFGPRSAESVEPTSAETASFSLIYQPATTNAGDEPPESLEAFFIDSTGAATEKLLSGESALTGRSGLAGAIRGADALIVAVDASKPDESVEATLGEFARLLKKLQDDRAQRTQVRGLPVFLVLTKCDQLTAAADAPAHWQARVEARKRRATEVFERFFSAETGGTTPVFGALETEILTAATGKPIAVDSSSDLGHARPAELLGHILKRAADFHHRRQRAGDRLAWTVLGTLTAMAAMIALSVFLALHRTATTSNLEEQILAYRAQEGSTAAERLGEPLAPKIARLREFQADPSYERLSPRLKEYVDGRLHEMQDYRTYLARLRRIRIRDLRRESDLIQLDEQLGTQLALPAPYRDDWRDTAAAKLHDQLASDVRSLRDAVTETAGWYRELARHGEELRTFGKQRPTSVASWNRWETEIGALLEKSPALEIAALKSDSATLVLTMESVLAARSNWEALRPKLERLRDLVAALGLAGELPGGVRQPLDIPAGFLAEQAAGYRQRVEKLYPRLLSEAPLIELPDAVADELSRVLHSRDERLIEAGRKVVLRELELFEPTKRETRAGWEQVRAWLQTATALPDWRVLATLFGRLLKQPNPDPVQVLADFLGKDHFDLHCDSLTLSLPSDLHLTPSGPLAIHHQPRNEPVADLEFKAVEEHTSGPPSVVAQYRFLPDGRGEVTYRPGDLLWATLPVKRSGVDGDWQLTWSMCRSSIYQFERLVRWPRLHRTDQQNLEGTIAEGVLLSIKPPGGVPTVPELLPIVKFASR